MYHYSLTAIFKVASWYSFKFINIESSTLLDIHISIPIARVAVPMKAHLPGYIFSQKHWMRTIQPSCSRCSTMAGRYNWISQLAACWASKSVPDITPLPVTFYSILVTTWWSISSIVISVSIRIVKSGIIDVITRSYIVGKKKLEITWLFSKVDFARPDKWDKYLTWPNFVTCLIFKKIIDFSANFWSITCSHLTKNIGLGEQLLLSTFLS